MTKSQTALIREASQKEVVAKKEMNDTQYVPREGGGWYTRSEWIARVESAIAAHTAHHKEKDRQFQADLEAIRNKYK